MTNFELKRSDLLENLEEQLYFLDSSISNYSQDKLINKYENKVIGGTFQTKLRTEIEAKRIAIITRILLHDTTNSSSLLGQLDLKNTISYLDSAAPNDGKLHSMTNMHGVRGLNSDPYLGLIAKVKKGDCLIIIPVFSQHLREWHRNYEKLDFENWWNNIIIKINGNCHSRKDLILTVANKDGGAHLDSKISLTYHATKKSNLRLNIQGLEAEFERNIVYASIAQIGWELLNSINLESV